MPRKGSRKSILEKKPKLDFVKSPVLGPDCPISPVLGALHPLTAKTVAVNESDTSWISSNFDELTRQALSTSRLKILRGKRTQIRQRHISADKENLSFRKNTNSRLKPLKFVRDAEIDQSECLEALTPPREESLSEELDICPTADVKTPEFEKPLKRRSNRLSKGRELCEEFGTSNKESCEAPNLIDSPLRILNFSFDDDKTSDVALSQARRSSRLRDKYLEAVKILHTPPHKPESHAKVLVVDTPENQYGLTLRRRQLAHLKGKVSLNPS